MKLSVFIAFVLFTSFLSAQETFENKQGGYKITVPAKWTVKQDSEITSVYAPEEGEMDPWREKLEISVSDANDLSLEEAFAFYIEQDVPALYDQFVILRQGEEEIKGLKSKWFVFSFTQSSVTLTNVFYLFLKNNKLFILQGIAEKSIYPNFENSYLEIIRSFQVTK